MRNMAQSYFSETGDPLESLRLVIDDYVRGFNIDPPKAKAV